MKDGLITNTTDPFELDERNKLALGCGDKTAVQSITESNTLI